MELHVALAHSGAQMSIAPNRLQQSEHASVAELRGANVDGHTRSLCCVWSAHGRLTPCFHPGSDRQGELIERDRHPLVHWLLDREFVVPASQVLYEAMPGDHDPGAAILLEAPHWTKPCLQPTVIAFDPVIGVSVGAMPGCGSSSSSMPG